MTEIPKYYLADVPHDLRRRVLDICFKRLWHDGLELLQQNGFNHYTLDDLLNFYSWAPTFLPGPSPEGGCVPQTGEQPQQSPHGQPELNEARQQLLRVLSARAAALTDAPTATAAMPHESVAESAGSSIDPSTQPSNAASLLTDLRDVIKRHVVLPEMGAEALALWIVHTYAFTLREVTTYIGVVSPEKRCGKTTLLELLGALAHEAVAAANISPSALFRTIEEVQPTLIIDEVDTFLHGRDEMAGILNAGYRKSNSYVMRVAEGKANRNRLVRFSCWCPKVMAAIGRLPDTLADRCIVITMQRKLPREKCERLRQLDTSEYQQRCAEFVWEHSAAIAAAQPEIPASLNDRAADIWEPLLAIADLAGGDWPAVARRAALKLSSFEDETSLIGHFLRDLRNWMLFKKVNRMLSRDIVTAFNPMRDRAWEDLRRGREINEWWLGDKMRELGIRPRNIRIGESVCKGYLLEDVEAAYLRYVPNPGTQTAIVPKESTGAGG